MKNGRDGRQRLLFHPLMCYNIYYCRLFEKRIDGVFIVHRSSHTVKERQETPNQEQSWDGKPRVRILKAGRPGCINAKPGAILGRKATGPLVGVWTAGLPSKSQTTGNRGTEIHGSIARQWIAGSASSIPNQEQSWDGNPRVRSISG